mgnify:CR=1 FL=1
MSYRKFMDKDELCGDGWESSTGGEQKTNEG